MVHSIAEIIQYRTTRNVRVKQVSRGTAETRQRYRPIPDAVASHPVANSEGNSDLGNVDRMRRKLPNHQKGSSFLKRIPYCFNYFDRSVFGTTGVPTSG